MTGYVHAVSIYSSDYCVAAALDEQYFTANGKTDTDHLFLVRVLDQSSLCISITDQVIINVPNFLHHDPRASCDSPESVFRDLYHHFCRIKKPGWCLKVPLMGKKICPCRTSHPPLSLVRNGGGNFTYQRISQAKKEVNRI